MDRVGHLVDHPRARSVWRAQQRHASRAGATYARFASAIESLGGYTASQADDYALAVIATLEEKLPFAAVCNLEAQMPSMLHEALEREWIMDLPTMDKQLFCTRVAARIGVSRASAEAISKVVLTVLRSGISAGEARRVEQLLAPDPELRDLWLGKIVEH